MHYGPSGAIVIFFEYESNIPLQTLLHNRRWLIPTSIDPHYLLSHCLRRSSQYPPDSDTGWCKMPWSG